MFYFLFLNIFRRHQRNFHFNPVHFDSGASPLFFIIGNWGISSLYTTLFYCISLHLHSHHRKASPSSSKIPDRFVVVASMRLVPTSRGFR